jgi:putative sterol carrier protein
MEVRVFDCWVHEQDVRRALDRPGGDGNHASGISLGRMEGAMPYVVGKKAGCAEGTAVRFEVDGRGGDARAFTVAVDAGRAKTVGPDVVPTVTLTMPTDAFVRLSCGRATAAQVEAAGSVEVKGDAAVARSVLDAMNFMF